MPVGVAGQNAHEDSRPRGSQAGPDRGGPTEPTPVLSNVRDGNFSTTPTAVPKVGDDGDLDCLCGRGCPVPGPRGCGDVRLWS